MRVIINKSVFEKYDVQGEEHEVIAVLEQLGFSPEKYVETPAKEKVEPTGPDWREVRREDLRKGDVVRVQLSCSNRYEAERIVTAPQGADGYVKANVIATGRESFISSGDIYTAIEVDMNRRGSEVERDWKVITYDDIKPGDIIRVTGEEEGSLLPHSLTGRDSEQRPQRVRVAYSEYRFGWKDMENRDVAMKSQAYHKIERLEAR